jgi:Sporulation related domain.
MEGNNENISVESEQPGTVQPDSTIEQATGIAEPVVTEQPKEAEVQTVIAEQPKVVTEQPKEEIAAQTPNPDELSPGHYVVIGTFSTRENAQEYMRKLRNSGYECNMGYASSRKSYYVYAYKTADLFEARRVRDNVREITEFEFPETWVLTIEK